MKDNGKTPAPLSDEQLVKAAGSQTLPPPTIVNPPASHPPEPPQNNGAIRIPKLSLESFKKTPD